MANKKKAKKPAANPARGFATTSVASSKNRADPAEATDDTPATTTTTTTTAKGNNNDASAPPSKDAPQANDAKKTSNGPAQPALSPEEFERQLEEAGLQILVEKFGPKVRRDALRQRNRLETDRRLLRGQAESINAKKWLPQELMDHVLDLIQAESRFAASSVTSEGASSKLPAEDDLIVRLWTLQQTLENSDFPQDKIQPALQFVLDIAPNISSNLKGDSIWGFDEVLDWLARECPKEELPDYSGRVKASTKSQAGQQDITSRTIAVIILIFVQIHPLILPSRLVQSPHCLSSPIRDPQRSRKTADLPKPRHRRRWLSNTMRTLSLTSYYPFTLRQRRNYSSYNALDKTRRKQRVQKQNPGHLRATPRRRCCWPRSTGLKKTFFSTSS